MKRLIWSAAVAAMGLAGCSSAPVVLNYAPSSTMTVKGGEQVGTFDYVPAHAGKIKPNQIRNTAIGNVLLDKNVDKYFEQALFTESRFVGITVNAGGPKVHGAINDFLIDDLGYSIDWTLNVTYIVDGQGGTDCYKQTKATKMHTAKFANPFGTLNEVMKQNIEALFTDSAFVSCIRSA
ncbi:MAG TPA: hypothetical protein VFE75_10120 [Rhodanobacter sp.]|jgi:hypothetical protein|nr:hypothetical protein [Rhodanobacter sp.]